MVLGILVNPFHARSVGFFLGFGAMLYFFNVKAGLRGARDGALREGPRGQKAKPPSHQTQPDCAVPMRIGLVVRR